MNLDKDSCQHLNKTIVVLSVNQVCEDTAIKCMDCNILLTKPTIDCV